MTLPLVDAHCHLHDGRLWSVSSPSSRRTFDNVLSRARDAHVTHVVSCATHQHDWRVLERLLEKQEHDNLLTIAPAFGVHPWWAQELFPMTEESLKPLRETLTRYPTASVGEIGLCKSAKGRQVLVDVQVEVFRVQLELAAEMERPCVLHCVGYYGRLLEILIAVGRSGGRLPPVLVLHSYSGPPDMMRSFFALKDTKVFFSLNAKQLTDPRMKKAAACCQEVPLEALLLETDAPDQAPSADHAAKVFTSQGEEGDSLPLLLQESFAGVNEPSMVKLALHSAAEIRGVEVEELGAAVYQNSKTAFGLDNLQSN